MRYTVLLLVVIVAISFVSANRDAEPIVETDLGKIKGTTLESRLRQTFFAFRGIRYANPPTGKLRFQAPEPVSPWEGVFDATDDGPMCIQPAFNRSEASEDCLRLNVYTKLIPNELSRIRPKDVIFYMHPGGFYVFSGQSRNNAGPQYLMDQDIVLVTINYRLGSLGFMSTGTPDCPGNMGFKDQVMALKWVRDHIHHFGGNAESVTLMGYSAGALSSGLHMISPMSRGLFHRVIAMSASPTSQVEISSHQIELAQKQATLLGCEISSTARMIECLKSKPASDFADSLEAMFVVSWNPVLLWEAVIEPDFGQERFLDRDPTEAFLKGDFMRVPVISGITKDEFAGPAVGFLTNETLRNELNQNFETLAPVLFLYNSSSERENITKLLRDKFLGEGQLTLNRSVQGLNYLFADSLIGFPVHRFIQLASRYTKVYQYKFTYQGRYSFFYYPDDKTPYGVVHHDDLLYLLVIPHISPIFNATDPESTMVEKLTGMWTAFAKHGDPNEADIVPKPNWVPVKPNEDNFLEIGEQFTMREGLFTERFSFWDMLFPLPENQSPATA
ncbi:juvenile hormone esterase-like [Toxorhynchites rutilus septentrionalis]|uniref:juvenile hormone esterase-like n=1 Tax=Toxorhynchites rutilus septentrionalis TaxID=329112 RepID=UPI002479F89C|nr:juvenile hormone esterase-like [Toxorhynchites rutilus septentrionalis]